MSEIKGLPQRLIGEPSAKDIALVKALLGEDAAIKYKGDTRSTPEKDIDAPYTPTEAELDAVAGAREENREFEKSAENTKRLWMEWADKEGIEREDIEEKATFQKDGTVHWDGDCDWEFVTSLPPQLVEVTGYLNLYSLTTLEAGAITGNVRGHLNLISLTTLEAGAIAGNVGGGLYLDSLTTLEAGAIVGNVTGYLNLYSLTTLEAGAIAGDIGGDLDLYSLTTLEVGVIAGNVGGNLDLNSLTTLEAGAITGNVKGNVYLSANNFSSEKQEEVKASYPTLRFEFIKL